MNNLVMLKNDQTYFKNVASTYTLKILRLSIKQYDLKRECLAN